MTDPDLPDIDGQTLVEALAAAGFQHTHSDQEDAVYVIWPDDDIENPPAVMVVDLSPKHSAVTARQNTNLLLRAVARGHAAEMALVAAFGHVPGKKHGYMSSSCRHGKHEHCRSTVNIDGDAKKPGTCKWCPAVCACPPCGHTPPKEPRGA